MLRAKSPFNRLLCATLMLAQVLGFSAPVHADRIKDIANIQGVQANQLVGVGLVTGLDGTGDQTITDCP